MKMATFTWVTYSGFQGALLQSFLSLPKLPILICPSFMFSFYTIPIPINVCAPKISHNLNCIISINHKYLSEDIIVFFIFYGIQFITHLHLSFISISVLSMTHFM